jgi:hypothetical protein
VSKIKAIALSIGDAMIFGSYTVLPTMVILLALGVIELNI